MGNIYRHKRKYKSNVLWTAFKSSIVVVLLLMLALILVVLIGYRDPSESKETESGELEVVYLNLPGMHVEEEVVVKNENDLNIEDTITENEADKEEEIHIVKQIEDLKQGPFNISFKWVQDSENGYVIRYRQLSANTDKHGKANREDNSMSMGEICTCFQEGMDDSGVEDANHGWHSFETDKGSFNLTGLSPDRDYEIHILYKDKTEEYLPKFTLRTASYGYGDPFESIDAFLTISTRDESTGKVLEVGNRTSVKMSSDNGCQNVVVKPVKDLPAYTDVSKASQATTMSKGAELKIMVDTNGNYCYLSEDKNYYVRVKDENENQGWVNARFLMVDAKGLFSPSDSVGGILIKRTNASASIFTAGGNGKAVDLASDENSRYDCLADGNSSTYLNSVGYNRINNVTGEKLANYGSSNQMPVIWDLALELIQCQKSSLENGCTLLMYEGYRPYSASQQVSGNLSGQGILANVVYNTNLAQGFLTDKSYDYSYYISKASRHNKGTATDLTLVKINSLTEVGDELPMQTKMHTLDFRCNMLLNNWQADLLSDIMMGHGSNLECLSVRSEWWHFQMNNKRTDIYPYIGEYEYYDIVF